MASRVVTLLTDFGTRDPYVGVMKAALCRHAPSARTIDLTHDVARQDVGIASFWLERAYQYFEAGTVHLVVVDPGVGTKRRPIAFELAGHFFVGPDNGVFTDLLLAATKGAMRSAVELDRESVNPGGRRGTTFDGRDLFAPAAAKIASGAQLETLGRSIFGETILSSQEIQDPLNPKVRAIDHYGNLITDAPSPSDLSATVSILGQQLTWVSTYGDAETTTPVALCGSWGTIEIAVNQGNAAEILGAKIGTPIQIQ